MTNEPLIPSSLCLSFTRSSSSSLHLLCASASFLFIPSLLLHALLSCSSLSFDNPFSQICYCHRKMSQCFQPFQPPLPSFHPTLPPTFSSPAFLCLFLCPSSLLVAAVNRHRASSLALTRGKLPLLISSPLLWALTLLSPPFLSPFCFCFHLLLLLQLHQQFSTLIWRRHGGL